jgi:hypothetical protein
MEGVITLIIVAALFYVAPGVLNSVSAASPMVPQAGNAALNASQVSIGTTAAGALNLSVIGLIMLGIGIMIGGFMLIRGYK